MDDLSNLFPARWLDRGAFVAGGYIANPMMTRADFAEHVATVERAANRAPRNAAKQRQAMVERLRLAALEPYFSAGATRAGEALAMAQADKLKAAGRIN